MPIGSLVATMFLTIQDLKVDQTFIPSENQGIFVTNVNIPEHELVNIDSVLDRVINLITSDYYNIDNIQYQVCATYQLRNTSTGDIRQWTGSFNPRGNQANTLAPFTRFTQRFKQEVTRAVEHDNIFAKLRFYHVETNWVFHKLTSIIVSFQSVMNLAHPTLMRRGLLMQRHGRRHRTIESFFLP